MPFDNTENGDNVKLDQKELSLTLNILKFQCDSAFDKKLKEIDSQLLNIGSKRQTVDILSDLLIQLSSVIGKIKAIGERSTVEKRSKIKSEIVENNEQGNVKNCDQRNVETTLSVTSKNQQLKGPKSENFIYSSSENEEESEEEIDVQQQSSQLNAQNCVEKLEKLDNKENVEIVPEIPEMDIEEIERLAAQNAKRDKRIRYFSTDSEDENINKKKRKKKGDSKSSSKKTQEKQTVENSQENLMENSKSDDIENSQEIIENDQEIIPSSSVQPMLSNCEIIDVQELLDKQIVNGRVSELTELEAMIGNFIGLTKQIDSPYFTEAQLNSVNLNYIQATIRSRISALTNPPIKKSPTEPKPKPKKSIKSVLEALSVKTLEKIEANRIEISKNRNDDKLTKKLNKTHNKNIKRLMQIKMDRYLIAVADKFWYTTDHEWTNKEKQEKNVSHRIDWEIKDFKISSSAHLRKALIAIFEKMFGNETPDVDNIFHEIIFHTMYENKGPMIMYGCKKITKILKENGFVDIVKDMTCDRMTFLEVIKKKVECNYKIEF